MSQPEQALFETAAYEDPRIRIPEVVGRSLGEYFGALRRVYFSLDTEVVTCFQPVEDQTECTSGNYAQEDDQFADDFKYWKPHTIKNAAIDGGYYIVGFPVIRQPEGNPVAAMHVWENNASIWDETFAVPLLNLGSLAMASKLRTEILLNMDELAMDGSGGRYEIPLVHDKKTGETHYRTAGLDDLSTVLDSMDDPAIVIHGYPSGIGKTAYPRDKEDKKL